MIPDEGRQAFRQYAMVPQKTFAGTPITRNIADGIDMYRGDRPFRGEEDDLVAIQRTQQPRLTNHKPLTETETKQKIEEIESQFGLKMPPGWLPQSSMNVPFSHGVLLFNSSTPTAFDEDDLAVASSFARMVSLGYARFLDFENLDRQNHALEAANRQVEQASLNKSQFLRRMSHDLRSPMNAIIGFSRLLQRRLADRMDEREARNLANIETSSGNLLNLINAILDLSRIEAGHSEVSVRQIDVRGLAGECADALESIVQEGVELRRELEDAGEILRGDTMANSLCFQ